MSFIKNQNQAVKNFRSFLCKENKKEYGLAFQDNPQRKGYTTGEALRSEYKRLSFASQEGASKHSYILQYIVVKRYKKYGWIGGGNQIEAEVKFYLLHKNDEWADLICPILRYGLHRGDKVESTAEKYLEECYIIAQKAVAGSIGNARHACEFAEELNNKEGYFGEYASDRYMKIHKFAKHFNMRDVMQNCGNCGVIFDYEKRCYKAVCIDYAL